ncbi:MAG: AMP-binding protein, partial [Desulfuromonadales bacterium]|nr:AMP-binding protein [Desulfuromonadales bacterium]
LEYLEIQGACLRSGFTLVPLNTRLADPELNYILGDAAPALLIAGREHAERVEGLGTAAGVKRLVGLGQPRRLDPYDSLLAAAEADPEADPLDPNLNTTILYTSGTTGRPKGAVIDRAGFSARLFIDALELEVRTEDVWLQSLPMFHIAMFLGCSFLFKGATAVMLPNFTPRAALEVMQREQVTSMVLVPTMISMLLDDPAIASADISRLRLIVYGGACIDPPLLRRAIARFGCGFHQQYGMTETGVSSILRPADHLLENNAPLASAGTEAAGFEVRIVDDQDRPLPTGEIGEIVCRGPGVMTGYWNLPEVSAETLRHGWMHTGDLGYRDESGFLRVVDRRNDMIITGGENVYPREIEAILAEHPAMPESAVIGLPDPRWGEVVCCILSGRAPAEAELESWLRERIAGYKMPRRWFRMAELPRNATGKVLKAELRRELAAAETYVEIVPRKMAAGG